MTAACYLLAVPYLLAYDQRRRITHLPPEQASSAAKRATREQATALADLRHWLARYLKIAKLALQAEPELLTALGLVAPSLSLPPRGMAVAMVLAEEPVA